MVFMSKCNRKFIINAFVIWISLCRINNSSFRLFLLGRGFRVLSGIFCEGLVYFRLKLAKIWKQFKQELPLLFLIHVHVLFLFLRFILGSDLRFSMVWLSRLIFITHKVTIFSFWPLVALNIFAFSMIRIQLSIFSILINQRLNVLFACSKSCLKTLPKNNFLLKQLPLNVLKLLMLFF